MQLYLVRHGQTSWNAENKVLGRTDIPLNEKGKKQAAQVAALAGGLPVDVILASPMTRTLETAEAISKTTGVPVTQEPDLIECDYGIYEGTDRNGEAYQEAKRDYFCRFPGGESFLDLAGRIYPLIKKIKNDYRDKNVMLVTHGGIGRIVYNYFHDMKNEEFCQFLMDNCEILEFTL